MALLVRCMNKKGKKFDPRIGCDGSCGNCAMHCAEGEKPADAGKEDAE